MLNYQTTNCHDIRDHFLQNHDYNPEISRQLKASKATVLVTHSRWFGLITIVITMNIIVTVIIVMIQVSLSVNVFFLILILKTLVQHQREGLRHSLLVPTHPSR